MVGLSVNGQQDLCVQCSQQNEVYQEEDIYWTHGKPFYLSLSIVDPLKYSLQIHHVIFSCIIFSLTVYAVNTTRPFTKSDLFLSVRLCYKQNFDALSCLENQTSVQ